VSDSILTGVLQYRHAICGFEKLSAAKKPNLFRSEKVLSLPDLDKFYCNLSLTVFPHAQTRI